MGVGTLDTEEVSTEDLPIDTKAQVSEFSKQGLHGARMSRSQHRQAQAELGREPWPKDYRLPGVLLAYLLRVHVKFLPAHGYLFVPLHIFPVKQPSQPLQ